MKTCPSSAEDIVSSGFGSLSRGRSSGVLLSG